MKKLVTLLLALVMVFAFAATASAVTWNDTQIPDYTDVNGLTDEQQVAIYRLTALGITNGMNGWGGTYAGDTNFTREQLAKIAVYLVGEEDAADLYASFGSAFGDVQEGRWSEGYINLAYELGLMKGVSTTSMVFNPTGVVSYQEYATVVLRAIGYDDNLPGSWPNDYSTKAVKMGLTKYTDYVGPKAINRADMAVMTDNALEEEMVAYVGRDSLSGIISAINDNYVDADGYAYSAWYTNEDDEEIAGTLLSQVFDCYPVSIGITFNGGEDALKEAAAWKVEDGDVEVYADWMEDDYDEWLEEKLPVAENYYIYGVNDLTGIAGHQADVLLYNCDDDDEWELLFAEITSSVELGKYDASEADVSEFFYDYFDILNDGFDPETDDVDNAAIYADDDDEVYAIYDYEYFMDRAWGIVDEVKTEKIEMKDIDSDDMDYYESAIKYYDEDDEVEYQLFYDMEAGKFVDADALEEGDVLYWGGVVGEEDDYQVNLFLIYSPKSAEIDKISGTYVKLDGERYDVLAYDYDDDEVYSLYSLDDSDFAKYAYEEVAEFDGATVFTESYVPGYFAYICDDVYSSVKGVVVDFDYKTDRSGMGIVYTSITLFEADGEEHEYDVDDVPEDEIGYLANAQEYAVEEGDYVKLIMTDGEEVDHIDVLADWSNNEDETISLKEKDYEDLLIKVESNNSNDLKDGDGNDINRSYEISEDATIYVLTSDGGDFDKVELMDAEDLVEDGAEYLVANFYADGAEADVLYLVDLSDYHEDDFARVALKTLGGTEATTKSGSSYYVWFYGEEDGEGDDYAKSVKIAQRYYEGLLKEAGAGVAFYNLDSNKVADPIYVIDGFYALSDYADAMENGHNGGIFSVMGDEWTAYVGTISDIHTNIIDFNYMSAWETNADDEIVGIEWASESGASKNVVVADIPNILTYFANGEELTDTAEVIERGDLEEGDLCWFILDDDGDIAYILVLATADEIEDWMGGVQGALNAWL